MAVAVLPRLDIQIEQPEPTELLPLSPAGLILYPMIRKLTSPARRDVLDRRAALARERIASAKDKAAIKKQVLFEAEVFGRILTDTWARMGEYHRPRNETDGIEVREKPKKTQKVRFERVFAGTEQIHYKIKVRERNFLSYKNGLPLRVLVGELLSDDALLELAMACERDVSAIRDEANKGAWVIVNRVKGYSSLPSHVSYQQILPFYPSDFSNAPFVLGVGDYRQVHTVDLALHPHALIAGATGSGKSNLLNNFLSSMIRFATPEELKLSLIDLKNMEFPFYRDAPHLGHGIISEASEAIECLEEVLVEWKRRTALMSGKAKELAAWNRKYPDQAMPRHIVVIDEFADLILSSGPKVGKQVVEKVNRITNLGRAVGIHVVVCTQRPAVEVLPNSIKINMPLIIAGRTQSFAQSKVILDDGSASELPELPKGRMIYLSGADRRIIQTPLIDDEDVIESVRIGRGRAKHLITLDGNDVVICRDKVLEFIASHGGRIDGEMAEELREHAITKRHLENLADDLVRTGEASRSGRTVELAEQPAIEVISASPVPVPVTEPSDKEKALATWRTIRQQRELTL